VTGIAGLESDNTELPAQLFPELLTTAKFDPCHDFFSRHSEWNGGEEIEGRGLALPVIFGRVVHVGCAGCNGIESFECANDFASRVNPDIQRSVRH